MATYRFSAKLVKRSAGRSVTAAAAYRAGATIKDNRIDRVFDYSRRRDVLHTEILAPAGTPDWMLDRAQLWNAIEAVEKRKDAQLAREIQLSLPHELTPEQRRELLREFVQETFVARGMIADISIHAPDREGDQRNHHAHVLLTLRELTGEGFGKKARDWNETALLEAWRRDWADAVNHRLEQYGHAARVDHRSYADQGIDREPEPKVGPIATEMEREGRPSFAGEERRAAQARNRERAEIEAELAAISAEIIDLDKEREQRQAPQPDAHVVKASDDAGLVAQQQEANRLLERHRAQQQREEAERQRMAEERLRRLAEQFRDLDPRPGNESGMKPPNQRTR